MGRIKRIGLLLALLAAALGLGGCGYDASVEELFPLPRMAEGYTDLAQQLDGLLNQGYEYASPTGGRNIQSVQMVDLDGDGRQEALAFMRRSSDEKPLKIFVFRMENENYQPYCTIESSGTAVDSVYYQDLNGDGRRELVVGWRISTDVQTVAVYAVEREPVALMSSGYTRFMMQDLNGDGLPSLLVLRTSEEGLPVAEVYGWTDRWASLTAAPCPAPWPPSAAAAWCPAGWTPTRRPCSSPVWTSGAWPSPTSSSSARRWAW